MIIPYARFHEIQSFSKIAGYSIRSLQNYCIVLRFVLVILYKEALDRSTGSEIIRILAESRDVKRAIFMAKEECKHFKDQVKFENETYAKK